MANDKPVVQIDNWSIRGGDDAYKAPEIRTKRLCGVVENHPRLGRDPNLVSSPIVTIDLVNRRVETLNTIYHIGKVNFDYLIFALNNSKPETVTALKQICNIYC